MDFPQEPESELSAGRSEEPLPEPPAPCAAPVELFASFAAPPEPVRRPHMGHALLMALLCLAGSCCTFAAVAGVVLARLLLHRQGTAGFAHEFKGAPTILGGMALSYLVSLGLGVVIFPRLWDEGFFTGVFWRGAEALRRWRLLLLAYGACLALALLSTLLISDAKHAPIEDMFKTPLGGWLMFAFGVTFAPFFEEMAFRGFLLPALCTAYDWAAEKLTHRAPAGVDAHGHPNWSWPAMVFGAVAASLPFALLHGEQTNYAIGPMLLLIGVSGILCGVRLYTRSLAASTLVHSAYNFLLFVLMAIGSGGFRHFEKM